MLFDMGSSKELSSLMQVAKKYPTISMTADYMNGFLRDIHKLPKVPENLHFCASAVQEEDGTYTIPSMGTIFLLEEIYSLDFLCMLENAVVGARWCALDTPVMNLV